MRSLSFWHWAIVIIVIALPCVAFYLLARRRPQAPAGTPVPENPGFQQRTYRHFKIAFALVWVALAAIIVLMQIEKQTGTMIPSLLVVPVVGIMLVSGIAYYIFLSRLAGYMGKSRIVIPGLAFLFGSLGGPIWAFLYMFGQAKARGWVPTKPAALDAARVG